MHVPVNVKDWPGASNEKRRPQATHEGNTKCLALRNREGAALMQVGQRETNGLDAVLENVFLDWPSLMTRREPLRQEGRLNAANSALARSE